MRRHKEFVMDGEYMLSGDAAIRYQKERIKELSDKDAIWAAAYIQLEGRIKELEASPWIPVSERLPEKDQYVLCSDGDGHPDTGYYDPEIFEAWGVTHWQPIRAIGGG